MRELDYEVAIHPSAVSLPPKAAQSHLPKPSSPPGRKKTTGAMRSAGIDQTAESAEPAETATSVRTVNTEKVLDQPGHATTNPGRPDLAPRHVGSESDSAATLRPFQRWISP